MITWKPCAAAALLAALLGGPALASTVALPTSLADTGYGQWQAFTVSDIESLSGGVEWLDHANSSSPGYGSAVRFNFIIGAGSVGTLRVVDGVFAGDTFRVTNFGSLLGTTSSVPATVYESAPNAGLDFDAAFQDQAFSRGVFQLQAGSYSIGGTLLQSVTFDGQPLNATLGAVSLTVSAVPEPSSVALMLAGLGMIGSIVRRGRRGLGL